MNFSSSFDECVYCGSSLLEGIIYSDETEETESEDNILLMSDEDILNKYNTYRIKLEKQLGQLSDQEFINGLKNARRDSILNHSLNSTIDNPPKSQIKCPTCSSTNVQKISTGERAISVAMLGLLSKKINKSFKCKDCGYTW